MDKIETLFMQARGLLLLKPPSDVYKVLVHVLGVNPVTAHMIVTGAILDMEGLYASC